MIALRVLTADDLPAVEPWFDDADTRHWLGDTRWPAGKLSLAGDGRQALLALIDDTPTALIDIDIGEDQRAAFAIVVAPARRGHGLGRAIVAACMSDVRFDQVAEWFAGVETGNVASQQLLLSCGFNRMTGVDADGFVYYARRRRGWPQLPWQVPWAGRAAPRPRPIVSKLASRTPA